MERQDREFENQAHGCLQASAAEGSDAARPTVLEPEELSKLIAFFELLNSWEDA